MKERPEDFVWYVRVKDLIKDFLTSNDPNKVTLVLEESEIREYGKPDADMKTKINICIGAIKRMSGSRQAQFDIGTNIDRTKIYVVRLRTS